MPWSSRGQPVSNCAVDDVDDRADPGARCGNDARRLGCVEIARSAGRRRRRWRRPAVDPHPLAASQLGAGRSRASARSLVELGAGRLDASAAASAAARGDVEAARAARRRSTSTANIRKTENRNSAIGETKRARSPCDVAAGQLAGPPGEQRQGPPELAVEMEHAVDEIVPEGGERAVDMAPSGRMRGNRARSARRRN